MSRRPCGTLSAVQASNGFFAGHRIHGTTGERATVPHACKTDVSRCMAQAHKASSAKLKLARDRVWHSDSGRHDGWMRQDVAIEQAVVMLRTGDDMPEVIHGHDGRRSRALEQSGEGERMSSERRAGSFSRGHTSAVHNLTFYIPPVVGCRPRRT